MSMFSERADEIGALWGPALTKFAKGEGMEDLKALFSPGVKALVVDKEGIETAITVGEEGEEGVSMTWSKFQELMNKDFVSAEYEYTKADNMGVLGNRMILEVCRFNKAGELYMNAVMLLTLNENGLIDKIEAFGDPEVKSITG